MKNHKETPSETDKLQEELDSLDELIGRLSLRAATVRKQLSGRKDISIPSKTQTASATESNQLRIGSRVIVRSTYKGRYGTIGTITKISGIYAWVQTASNRNRTIQVQLSNLEHHHD